MKLPRLLLASGEHSGTGRCPLLGAAGVWWAGKGCETAQPRMSRMCPTQEFQNRGSGAGTGFWKEKENMRVGYGVRLSCCNFSVPRVSFGIPRSPAQRPGRLAVGLLSPLEGPLVLPWSQSDCKPRTCVPLAFTSFEPLASISLVSCAWLDRITNPHTTTTFFFFFFPENDLLPSWASPWGVHAAIHPILQRRKQAQSSEMQIWFWILAPGH